MRLRTFCILSILFLFFCQDLFSQVRRRKETTVRAEINNLVDDYMAAEGNVGLIIGIITDTAEAIIPYGSIKKDTLIRPIAQTLYEIGSLTKLFTALTILEMDKAGKLSLKDPLSKFLPDSIVSVNSHLNNLTIDQLLVHTSGLPKRPYNLNLVMKDKENPYAEYSLEDMMEYLSIYRPNLSKDAPTYKYSNLAFGILGYVMTQVEGKNVDECIRAYCTSELDMTSSRIELSERDRTLLAEGHMFNGTPTGNWTYNSMEASSGMYSNISDLMAFMNYQLESEKCELSESIALSHLPQAKTNLKRISIGYGWHVIDRGRKYETVYTHNGGTSGYRSYIAFIKETHTAVVVLSNSANRVDDIGIQVLELINYGVY